MMSFISSCSRLTTGAGVPAGALSTCHDTSSRSFTLSASASVGTSGSVGSRNAVVTASARNLPLVMSVSAVPASANESGM